MFYVSSGHVKGQYESELNTTFFDDPFQIRKNKSSVTIYS